MRHRTLFLPLLLLCFSIACSNKSSDQSANADQPSNASTPATSEPSNPSASAAKPPVEHGTSQRSSSEKPAAAKPVAVVVPAGTAITVRTQTALSSGKNQSGDTFSATLADPITVDGRELVPAGAQAEGTVAEAKAKGKIKGAATLRLELTRLTVNGTAYPIQTSMAGFASKGKGKRTAVTTGGGAALGALIGGLAGGGKGAAIGALAGGGAGFAGGTLTGNKQIEL
ncbi:MAG: hypothetical protein ACXVZV_05355, partial [Terriglobales bacterium]